MRRLPVLLLTLLLAGGAALAQPLPTRMQALRLLQHPQAPERAAAVARLAEVGTMADSAPATRTPRMTHLPVETLRGV